MSLIVRVSKILALMAWVGASSLAAAGELILTNGDRIEGSLISVNKSSLTWKSTNFGDLTIAKGKVADLSSSAKVKIQGEADPCVIEGMEGHFLTYHCGDEAREGSVELMALKSIVPFIEHTKENYEYAGRMAVSGTFSRGNKIEDDLELDAGITFRHEDFRHVMEIDYESNSNDGDPSEEDYEVLYRLDWFFDERWFWYNEGRVGREETKNVDERYTLGSGLGVQLWENPNSALALESGFDYVKELLEPSDGDRTNPDWESSVERTGIRFATRYRYKLPFAAEFIHTNELLYSLKDSADWTVSADFGINVPLGPGLFSEYKFEYDYDNLPPNDTKSEDTKFTFGVGYEW